jgi:hypothetical protein
MAGEAKVAMALMVLVAAVAGCAGQQVATAPVHVVVVDAPPGVTSFEFRGDVPISSGATGLSVLSTFAAEKGFTINTTFYESFQSTIVNGINGLDGRAGDNGSFYYWKFFVGDTASDVGADQVRVSVGMATSWKFVLESA